MGKDTNIPIEVFTNIDTDKNIIWPRQLCCRPVIGDMIMSLDCKHIRTICSITHNFLIYLHNTESSFPYLKIEVTK